MANDKIHFDRKALVEFVILVILLSSLLFQFWLPEYQNRHPELIVNREITIKFGLNSDTLNAEDYNAIQSIAKDVLRRSPIKITATSDTIGGRSQYNLDLSRRRALAVRNVLIEFNVPESEIEYIGIGSFQPKMFNAEDRAAYIQYKRVQEQL